MDNHHGTAGTGLAADKDLVSAGGGEYEGERIDEEESRERICVSVCGCGCG